MKFFFKTRKFKIIAVSSVLVIAAALSALAVAGGLSPFSALAGAVVKPINEITTEISHTVNDFSVKFKNNSEILLENERLKQEINSLHEQIADYEQIQTENEFYQKYLELKEENKDFKFQSAISIATDNDSIYGGFTVNKGSLDGISAYDPVITEAGLVGYVSQVGLKTAKVTTLISPEITVGANDNRTGDAGIISGTGDFASSGLTKFYNLSRSCNIAVGDYVVTSGEGIFPRGLLIGTVEGIKSDTYSGSIYASVKPFADLSGIRDVMIITYFDGQGGLTDDN